ncbi:cob(I)yrinic acid a,c-diamide adenosyltransferase [Aurantibacter crassamenti]|uniref:cob(I)yrinic acid a,c-diamide adenosyltransferase n=1 Tax=Aurantibacter crassamenti TaxID=1837375 RepID=UPI001939343C|nr:cob(I)yrinic acid a,c-diamide adenosyltransferase [Aurantibacter crassamenti]MBM1106479.1 cob(I)yrinic acid a,c-diamide adenosyltransferase [Aurantibacter crassamenti]
MKIYTKTGDKGQTSLYGGTRVSKHNLRIDALGCVDELNSWLGLLKDQEIDANYKVDLLNIQHKLFIIGAILATDPEKAILKSGEERLNINKIDAADVSFLENEIDLMNEVLPEMTHFILPGGHTTVSYCHIARTVCRRAERSASTLNEHQTIDSKVLSYLNRLSDYLFVLARKLSLSLNVDEIKWMPAKKG